MGIDSDIQSQTARSNPWAGVTSYDIERKNAIKRAAASGDVGLGGLETALGSAPPTVNGGVAALGQMGAISAEQARRASDGGMFRDPATGQQYDGLSGHDMDAYLLGSTKAMPTVGGLADASGAFGAGRTADTIGTAALSRGFNPLEYTQDPTADVSGMLAQRDYLRQVAGGAPTAAQSQLAAGLDTAQRGQASIAAGVRGSQAGAARRAASESQLDIRNQGIGQMEAQRAADQMSAQQQLQDLNQGVTAALAQRQGLYQQGQVADAGYRIQNQSVIQDSLRAQLANLATRNDLTAEQKQQAFQAIQAKMQADRMAQTYALRARQMGATRDLNYANTDIGNAAAGGTVSDRVSMAHFDDATQRGAATTAAIGTGAGMAIRGLSGGSTQAAPAAGGNYAGADVNNNPYAGYA